jgi:GTP-binding protein Era
MSHRAGFVNLVGKPNAGKSTLMNRLVGERISIITPKAQTTRHRILGIVNTDDYQIVFSDTPGYIDPAYGLHRSMMGFVDSALEDADILLYLIDAEDKEENADLSEKVKNADCKKLIILNKVDMLDPEKVQQWYDRLEASYSGCQVLTLSALHGFHVPELLQLLVDQLPVHPPFYDKEELTDKPERFFAAEIIREQIFNQYQKEIPYCCEVAITTFEESEELIKIHAEIFVERDSQKGIIIGHQGKGLKRVGTDARKAMETFFQKKIFLQTHVKVKPNWRNDQRMLNLFGYNPS